MKLGDGGAGDGEGQVGGGGEGHGQEGQAAPTSAAARRRSARARRGSPTRRRPARSGAGDGSGRGRRARAPRARRRGRWQLGHQRAVEQGGVEVGVVVVEEDLHHRLVGAIQVPGRDVDAEQPGAPGQRRIAGHDLARRAGQVDPRQFHAPRVRAVAGGRIRGGRVRASMGRSGGDVAAAGVSPWPRRARRSWRPAQRVRRSAQASGSSPCCHAPMIARLELTRTPVPSARAPAVASAALAPCAP